MFIAKRSSCLSLFISASLLSLVAACGAQNVGSGPGGSSDVGGDPFFSDAGNGDNDSNSGTLNLNSSGARSGATAGLAAAIPIETKYMRCGIPGIAAGATTTVASFRNNSNIPNSPVLEVQVFRRVVSAIGGLNIVTRRDFQIRPKFQFCGVGTTAGNCVALGTGTNGLALRSLFENGDKIFSGSMTRPNSSTPYTVVVYRTGLQDLQAGTQDFWRQDPAGNRYEPAVLMSDWKMHREGTGFEMILRNPTSEGRAVRAQAVCRFYHTLSDANAGINSF